jgi:hypothetical protein
VFLAAVVLLQHGDADAQPADHEQAGLAAGVGRAARRANPRGAPRRGRHHGRLRAAPHHRAGLGRVRLRLAASRRPLSPRARQQQAHRLKFFFFLITYLVAMQ